MHKAIDLIELGDAQWQSVIHYENGPFAYLDPTEAFDEYALQSDVFCAGKWRCNITGWDLLIPIEYPSAHMNNYTIK